MDAVPTTSGTRAHPTGRSLAGVASGVLPGDARASWSAFVAHHGNAAYNLAHRLVGDDATAAGVVQDAFIEAYRDRRRQGITATAGRVVRSIVRAAVRTSASAHPQARPPSEGGGPGEALDVAERAAYEDAVLRDLDALPVRGRVVAVLRHVGGLSVRDIADLTTWSEAVVAGLASASSPRLGEGLRNMPLREAPMGLLAPEELYGRWQRTRLVRGRGRVPGVGR